ncbi:MAG: shikimate dehydrogenase [Chloroflexota bacterium]|nr:shikimate dehydrogenase [Chloroflexota bacterium]MBI5705110.1 shikimate dehydrogenase [Chloroflexota bacterium]
MNSTAHQSPLTNHQLPITNYHLGLIGYPLSHTLSPKIHAAALQACGLQGEYVPFTIYPNDTQGLKNILRRLRAGDLHGLNVTIPHKQNVIPFLDELTPTAQAIGAVNTIYMQGGKLIGDNTDAAGFLADLKKFLAESPSPILGEGTGVREKSAIVLGAGGSARAVVHALLNDGWNVTLAARRIEQAEQLAGSFANYQLQITTFDLRPSTFDLRPLTFDLIVNTTPLGMTPNIETSPLPETATFRPGTIVYDLVYNPRETKLVRQAKAQGCRAVSGLGMLIEQAALSFQIWTGYNPPRQALYNSLLTDH